MRYLKLLVVVFSILLITSFMYLYKLNVTNNGRDKYYGSIEGKSSYLSRTQKIFVICVVVCGENRTEEVLNMIKSALLFSQQNSLKFIIFSELNLFRLLRDRLEMFRKYFNFVYDLKEVKFPNQEVRNLFKPCASQRLFLPSLVENDSEVIYVDSDVIFLSPLSGVFDIFKSFNSSQIAALAPEAENGNGWYSR